MFCVAIDNGDIMRCNSDSVVHPEDSAMAVDPDTTDDTGSGQQINTGLPHHGGQDERDEPEQEDTHIPHVSIITL